MPVPTVVAEPVVAQGKSTYENIGEATFETVDVRRQLKKVTSADGMVSYQIEFVLCDEDKRVLDSFPVKGKDGAIATLLWFGKGIPMPRVQYKITMPGRAR